MDIKKEIKRKIKFKIKLKKILLYQFYNFKNSLNYKLQKHNYQVGDIVILKKGTLLHGLNVTTIEKIENISKNGIISGELIDSRNKNVKQKYPYCVCCWNIQNEISLEEYINLYSGCTLKYRTKNGEFTKLVSYEDFKNGKQFIPEEALMWECHQTKEMRFMPSLNNEITGKQNQIAFIINSFNDAIKPILQNDIFSKEFNQKYLKYFVLPKMLKHFKNSERDDFFTNRECAIILGIPKNFIEGILVGKIYENDEKIIKKIKELFPNSYIANLEGKVIKI